MSLYNLITHYLHHVTRTLKTTNELAKTRPLRITLVT